MLANHRISTTILQQRTKYRIVGERWITGQALQAVLLTCPISTLPSLILSGTSVHVSSNLLSLAFTGKLLHSKRINIRAKPLLAVNLIPCASIELQLTVLPNEVHNGPNEIALWR
jgi:hypothetical protein